MGNDITIYEKTQEHFSTASLLASFYLIAITIIKGKRLKRSSRSFHRKDF
jgi:hypothetical protein